MRLKGTVAVVATMMLLANAGVSSQAPDGDPEVEAMRTYLLQALQRNLELDLAYLASAPDSMLRWAPTEGVRDFAQVIAHTTHDFFRPWRSGAPAVADTAAYLNDRDLLAEHLSDGYGWALDLIREMAPEELSATQTEEYVAGQPRWRVYLHWIEHAMWTRATTVPYLRMNGVVPPAVRFFG